MNYLNRDTLGDKYENFLFRILACPTSNRSSGLWEREHWVRKHAGLKTSASILTGICSGTNKNSHLAGYPDEKLTDKLIYLQTQEV